MAFVFIHKESRQCDSKRHCVPLRLSALSDLSDLVKYNGTFVNIKFPFLDYVTSFQTV